MSGIRRRALLGGLLGLAGSAGAASCTSDKAPIPDRALSPLSFPDGFLWGAATSAYQVEGAANEGGRTASVWDTFTQGGANGDVTADQYHHCEADIALMAEMGLTAYRFSISWPRLQPDQGGPMNPVGLDYYKRLIDGLLEAGISPVACLWHWDTPAYIQSAGGWESRDSAFRFADYCDAVFSALGAQVPTYLTINEPKSVVQLGYLTGRHPPGKADPVAATRALHHLLLAHGLAVEAFRGHAVATSRIGLSLGLADIQVVNQDAGENLFAEHDVRENTLYLDPILRGRYPPGDLSTAVRTDVLDDVVRDGDMRVISSRIDDLGINYYGCATVGGPTAHERAEPATWLEIDPDSLRRMLVRIHREYGAPSLLITENGRPSAGSQPLVDQLDDLDRIDYLRKHLVAAHRAIAEGVRLRGWHVWSLLDNFEWTEGYTQRWGLVYVDFDSLERRRKASSVWYEQVARANAVTI